MHSSKFAELNLSQPLLRALDEEGYDDPTPIQHAAIPAVLEGNDVLAAAQTGTGKTAAFTLPMLQLFDEGRVKGGVRGLILTPTRELALQIAECLGNYGRHLRLRTAVLLGGVSERPQIDALRRKPDFIVATPGRLLDLHQRGLAKLDRVEILVLDEADRMLDMGFSRDVRRIVGATPRSRQTLLFSATLTEDIGELAADLLRDPSLIEVTPPASVSDNVAQKVLFVAQEDKRDLLTSVLEDETTSRVLVFTRTKHRANRLTKQLRSGGIKVDVMHSNKGQGARQAALKAFHNGQIKVLVATDIAARGIDVDDISHVINYEMPGDPESYVHRIGRTARAGSIGMALSFCNAEEVELIKGIERLTRSPLVADEDHPFHSASIAAMRSGGTPAAARTRTEQSRRGKTSPRVDARSRSKANSRADGRSRAKATPRAITRSRVESQGTGLPEAQPQADTPPRFGRKATTRAGRR